MRSPLANPGAKPQRLALARDLVRSLRRGHPWVFRDALKRPPSGAPGDIAELSDKRGKVVARGYVDTSSALSFRACTAAPREALDDAWAHGRFKAAWDLREMIRASGETTGYRLFAGEGDSLPGLVCDLYGSTAVIRLDGPAAEGFWCAEGVADWLQTHGGITTAYQRLRTRGEPEGRLLCGPLPDGPVPFVENGLHFTADIQRGQKTGFFLDQRDNRARVGALCRDRTVLNMFGYTGGFSVYAAAGGATHVTTVDVARPALEATAHHMALNQIPTARHEESPADAFEFLAESAREKRRWDVVILDPPAFAPNQKSIPQATSAYQRLIGAGAAVTQENGWLVAASCSSHIGMEAFVTICQDGVGQARKTARVVGSWHQAMDHPWPLAFPDFRYLKAILMRIEP
ncbi:MAG: class I SAM-dependent rRNA methyltransferase [Myxococcota bacterium]|nr:class I SAM-dependent rRNA methyltransferase [Myxococcota bacterium]MEE2780034.1 class I SAM-dependent rRNA methyltransferase [Myxococcota bacterium]